MARAGANLALLLLGGFRTLANAATETLAKQGYEDYRPAHEFAMRAIASGADTASELGRKLSMSKQAAAKTIALLERRGYVARASDCKDARQKRLVITPLGFEVMAMGEAIFDALREQWAKEIGQTPLQEMELCLRRLLDRSHDAILDPSWLSQGDSASE